MMLRNKRPPVRIDSVTSRAKALHQEPYWQRISEGRYIGFRRMTAGTPGTWLARCYDPHKAHEQGTGEGGYHSKPLGEFADIDEKHRYDCALEAAKPFFEHISAGGTAKAGTVRQACEDYVKHVGLMKGPAAATDVEGFYKRHVYRDPIAHVELVKATRQTFSSWRKRVFANSASVPAFNRNLTPLRAALNHAKDEGAIVTDAAWSKALKPLTESGKEGATLRPSRPRELYLDPAQRALLIKHATPETRRFLNTLRLLPLRPGDVANLKVQHFNARAGTLSIPAGKTKRRDVLLSKEAAQHFRECATQKLPAAWLVSRDDGSQWKKEWWGLQVKLAAAGAHLPPETVAYSLRHSTITDLVRTTRDLLLVAQLSGTSVLMIQANYGKLIQDRAQEALEGLAALA